MNREDAVDVLTEASEEVTGGLIQLVFELIEDIETGELVYVEDLSIDELLFALQARLLDENVTAEGRLEKALWADAMKVHGEAISCVQRIDHMLAEEEGGADGE